MEFEKAILLFLSFPAIKEVSRMISLDETPLFRM